MTFTEIGKALIDLLHDARLPSETQYVSAGYHSSETLSNGTFLGFKSNQARAESSKAHVPCQRHSTWFYPTNRRFYPCD
eukprot:6176275-Pleurochrysis_carterae.AAC.1